MVIYIEDFLVRRREAAIRAPRLVAAVGGGNRPTSLVPGMALPTGIHPTCMASEHPPLDLAKLYEEASLI